MANQYYVKRNVRTRRAASPAECATARDDHMRELASFVNQLLASHNMHVYKKMSSIFSFLVFIFNENNPYFPHFSYYARRSLWIWTALSYYTVNFKAACLMM